MKYDSKIRKSIVLLCIGLCIWGCDKRALTVVEYIRWVEDESNGLIVSKVIQDFVFSVQYKPLNYVALKSLKRTAPDEEQLSKEMVEIEDLQYYTLRIGTNDGTKDLLKAGIESEDDYFMRIEYFSFHIQKDLQLIDGLDTLPCVLHHFERTYGITPHTNIVLAFKLPEDKSAEGMLKAKTLIYNDQILGTGKILLTIKEEDLRMIPHLMMN